MRRRSRTAPTSIRPSRPGEANSWRQNVTFMSNDEQKNRRNYVKSPMFKINVIHVLFETGLWPRMRTVIPQRTMRQPAKVCRGVQCPWSDSNLSCFGSPLKILKDRLTLTQHITAPEACWSRNVHTSTDFSHARLAVLRGGQDICSRVGNLPVSRTDGWPGDMC